MGLACDADRTFIPKCPTRAVNNYRQSSGGGFPDVTTAPVVHNAQQEIRQLIIDWVTSHKVIDPLTFASMDWQLVLNGVPVAITTP